MRFAFFPSWARQKHCDTLLCMFETERFKEQITDAIAQEIKSQDLDSFDYGAIPFCVAWQ